MTAPHSSSFILAGDIGGTKTSLALFQQEKDSLTRMAETTVNNDQASNLEEIVENFLQQNVPRPKHACFGVAGPVSNNRVKMTNYEWFLDGNNLMEELEMHSVLLINDLVATAMGAIHLPADRLLAINAGIPDPAGAIAVIAPGTGLGESFLVRCGDSWLPIPSEGGHAAFSPNDELQRRLLHYMGKQHDHVPTELVCSGMGIPALYGFLCAENGTSNQLDSEADATRIIIEKALGALEKNRSHDLTLQALRLFIAILATESANLVLKTLATGGLFIGGGLPPRLLPLLKTDLFMNSFLKSDYREMLSAIPVQVILEPQAALIGAAAYGFAYGPGE